MFEVSLESPPENSFLHLDVLLALLIATTGKPFPGYYRFQSYIIDYLNNHATANNSSSIRAKSLQVPLTFLHRR